MKIVKGYKFRLKTNNNINVVFSKIASFCRFVYNHFLRQKIDLYGFNLITINYVNQTNQLPDLKKNFVWLKEVPSQMIQQSLIYLDQAYKNFATLSTGKKYKPLNSFRKLENKLGAERNCTIS